VGGNESFPAEVEIVAHANTGTRMGRMEALKGKPGAMPDRTFEERLTLGHGAEQIDLYHFGAGHTDGDALIVFPALRVLHTGDFFPGKEAPVIDVGGGGSAVAYPDTLARATKTLGNIGTIIPGHAPLMTWADLQDFEEFNREFLAAARAAHQAGKTPAQAMAELELPAKFSAYNMKRAAVNMAGVFAELSR
jgi:glyoxylase-like metal-dependent hydrolase (beta-lactamase superfamily II)